MLHAGGENQCGAGICGIVGADGVRCAGGYFQHFFQLDAGAQCVCLTIQAVSQFRAGDGSEAGKIFHLGGGGDLSTETFFFQQ